MSKFDGKEMSKNMEWINQANEYFELHCTQSDIEKDQDCIIEL